MTRDSRASPPSTTGPRGLAGFAGAFLSLRFWTYFLCFGGLAGASLTWLQLSAPAPPA